MSSLAESRWWHLFHKEVKSWDSTTWFRIWQFQTPTEKRCFQLHLLAEQFVSWRWWSGFSERVKTYLMAPMSPLDSPTFFCLHIYSLWLDLRAVSIAWSLVEHHFVSFLFFVARGRQWSCYQPLIRCCSTHPGKRLLGIQHGKLVLPEGLDVLDDEAKVLGAPDGHLLLQRLEHVFDGGRRVVLERLCLPVLQEHLEDVGQERDAGLLQLLDALCPERRAGLKQTSKNKQSYVLS